MKKHLYLLALLLFTAPSIAQEKFGKTFNLGGGATYYGYVGHASPVVMLNYEIDLVRNVTLAPFIGFFTYRNHYDYWHGHRPPRPRHDPYYYDRYYYRQVVVPFGVKGTYYFDDLLNANKKWDFYAALSLGFAIRSTRWERDYYDNTYEARRSSVYADLHIGTECHVNGTIGLFADASLGMILVGLAVHHK